VSDWKAEEQALVRSWKTSDLLRAMAYCEKYSHDPRLEHRAKCVAEEIDRRFPVT